MIAGVDSTGRLQSSRSLLKQHTVDCSSESIEAMQGFWGSRMADYQIASVRSNPRLINAYASHRKERRPLPILSLKSRAKCPKYYTELSEVNCSDDTVATIVWPAV